MFEFLKAMKDTEQSTLDICYTGFLECICASFSRQIVTLRLSFAFISQILHDFLRRLVSQSAKTAQSCALANSECRGLTDSKCKSTTAATYVSADEKLSPLNTTLRNMAKLM
jgi:hypothetical protein